MHVASPLQASRSSFDRAAFAARSAFAAWAAWSHGTIDLSARVPPQPDASAHSKTAVCEISPGQAYHRPARRAHRGLSALPMCAAAWTCAAYHSNDGGPGELSIRI